jgi:cellulose synthase/poly-beta-1,6-N-acetylglucosamine synthase-like glycosyltransferase
MPRAKELMQAIVGEEVDLATVIDILEEALLTEQDPLLHAVFTLGLDIRVALQRAARHIGVAYFDVIPGARDPVGPLRLERLADLHMVRVSTMARDVAYSAPDFGGLMRLWTLRLETPGATGRVCIVPPAAMRQYLAAVASEDLLASARQNLVRHWPMAAASLELTLPSRLFFVGFVLVALLALISAPFFAPAWLMPIWTFVVLSPALLRLKAIMEPAPRRPRTEMDESELPIYSVLVPLRDEAEMVDQLYRHLGAMDYPAHLLDIIFVVEERSPATLEAVRSYLGDARFSLIEVPHAQPLTKPKALDFALPFCRGEFVVVFDAEDRPEPTQLRQIVRQFRRMPEIHCIQARLVVTNGDKGALPGLFAGEYAAIFSVFLPALARWGLVMPLGGTSNHFRLADLRAIGGWDAYNVTEDADIGVRLGRRNLTCATHVCATYEEAPETLVGWFGQRRRWMKGWMQTFIVHNRHPIQLLIDLGLRRFLAFQVVVLGMILMPLLHSAFLVTCLVWLVGWGGSLRIDLWSTSCLIVFAVGYGAAYAIQYVGLWRARQMKLWHWQLLLPLYWLLIALATLRALLDLTQKPFVWIKTAHRPVSDTTVRQSP